MRLDRLTIKAQEALQEAQNLADRNNSQEIGTEHLLAALLSQPEGIVVPILQKLGLNPDNIRREADTEISRRPKVSGGVSGQLYLSQDLNQALNLAWEEAQTLKDEYVSTEHLLLGLATETRALPVGS